VIDPAEVRLRTWRPGDEVAIVDLLNRVYPSRWGDLDRWRARHSGRPDFDPRDIRLAEHDGKLVGCLHSAVYTVGLGAGLALPMAIDGNLAIHPEYRGRGIPESLYAASSEEFHARSVPLRFGHSESDTRVFFYCRALGYVSCFDYTQCWKKHLDPAPVLSRLLGLFGAAPEDPDPGRGPTLGIELTGLPPIRLRLNSRGVAPAAAGRAGLVISGDQRLLGLFDKEGITPRTLLALRRSGGFRIRGTLPGGLSVLYWAIVHGWRLRRRAQA
jgi:predicted N-acetyltransferase YhbS